MKRLIIVPSAWPCKLGECPPGYFLFQDNLCLKSGYKTKSQKGFWQSDAYCESGEYFWGGVKTSDDREELIVTPAEAIWEEYEA